jgi:ABC-type polysaccharide/polyol phosphate export permease
MAQTQPFLANSVSKPYDLINKKQQVVIKSRNRWAGRMSIVSNSSFGRIFFGGFEFLTLVYHGTVRDVRKSKGNAVQALAMEVLQSAMVVIFFYVLITFLGMRGVAVRGSFVLYVLTGVFLYITHNKAVSAVGGGGPVNPMLQHAPVSTMMLIVSGAISALYVQILAVLVISFVANVLIDPFTVYDLKRVALCFMIAWFSGCAIGIIILSIRPFFPATVTILEQVYKRANMIFSGKMFLANSLPGYMLPFFLWNPLFHTIDQARGAAFVNYTAHRTSLEYAIHLSLVLICLGMMLEHWARKYVSDSWSKRR